MTTLREAFREQERKCGIFLELISEFREELLIENKTPSDTMLIYFKSIQLSDYIANFIDVIKEFNKLYTFKDIFEDNDFKVNDLWLYVDNIRNNNNFIHLIDKDFIKSKNRTLRLWGDIDYKEILELFENNIKKLLSKLENIEDKWYNYYIHLEANNSETNLCFINKEDMELWKLKSLPLDENNCFVFRRIQFYSDREDISDVIINPENIRTSLKFEVFLENRISEYLPEYFL